MLDHSLTTSSGESVPMNMSWTASTTSSRPKAVKVEELTNKEMEAVTTVFRSFETGLREATIYPKVSVNSFSTLSIGNWKKCEDGMNHDPLDSRILMGLVLLGTYIIKRGFEEL